MTDYQLYALLRHESLPAWLSADLLREMDYGVAKDGRVLLAAAVEGVLVAGPAAGLHRLTVLEPLTAARLLAKDPLIGKRLWPLGAAAVALGIIERTVDLQSLLNYWCRARLTYRGHEAREAAAKVHYADGRPVNLNALKVA